MEEKIDVAVVEAVVVTMVQAVAIDISVVEVA